MSYFRASTGNPLGWRNNNTVTLGNEIRHAGPDWKTVAAQHDAAIRAGRQMQASHQRAAQYRMAAVDAAARGDRTRVRMPRLSGLGMLSNGTQMVHGAQYIFHFTGPNTLVASLSGALANQIAADTNFGNPVVSAEPTGMRVAFTYNGPGTTPTDTVGNYGAEMQNVLRSQTAFSSGFLFSGGEGGPVLAPGATGTPVFMLPDGTLADSNGNPIASNTSNPGDQSSSNAGSSSSFDFTSFFEGMGLSAGVGLALTAGLAILIFKN